MRSSSSSSSRLAPLRPHNSDSNCSTPEGACRCNDSIFSRPFFLESKSSTARLAASSRLLMISMCSANSRRSLSLCSQSASWDVAASKETMFCTSISSCSLALRTTANSALHFANSSSCRCATSCLFLWSSSSNSRHLASKCDRAALSRPEACCSWLRVSPPCSAAMSAMLAMSTRPHSGAWFAKRCKTLAAIWEASSRNSSSRSGLAALPWRSAAS
mmetsp:Transcript_147989/g.368827  ORF Transcript_147989/g.368827 Transcript_147989/m.368827 type:complete len:217 (-) Transcript_147989:224-874(-)